MQYDLRKDVFNSQNRLDIDSHVNGKKIPSGLIVVPNRLIVVPSRDNLKKRRHFSMCSRMMNWSVGNDNQSTRHMSVKGDVHVKSNTKSRATRVYTVTSQLGKT